MLSHGVQQKNKAPPRPTLEKPLGHEADHRGRGGGEASVCVALPLHQDLNPYPVAFPRCIAETGREVKRIT